MRGGKQRRRKSHSPGGASLERERGLGERHLICSGLGCIHYGQATAHLKGLSECGKKDGVKALNAVESARFRGPAGPGWAAECPHPPTCNLLRYVPAIRTQVPDVHMDLGLISPGEPGQPAHPSQPCISTLFSFSCDGPLRAGASD